MWKLNNRGVVVLVIVSSGCAILNTISGALIGILLSLIFVIYACITLLTDENLVIRHAFTLFDYFKRATIDLYKLISETSLITSGYVLKLFKSIKLIGNNYIIEKMNHRSRRNTYQLSSESFTNVGKNSVDIDELNELSPIPKTRIYSSESENNIYGTRNSLAYESARAFDKVTSTPMTSWKQRESSNGISSGDSRNIQRSQFKKSTIENSNSLNSSRDNDTVYSTNETSPWGTTISPKIRPRAAGIKTVQTVAGPLLASTRYNIDTKTYADVTSPGLTSRLTKYATEANNKLGQSPYGTGQFPKVNLNSSPTPLINSKTGKIRLPVTVRVAPPETRYSPPERSRILSEICQSDSPKTSPSVAQVLREISLKRHASREDVAAELIKKQRTDGIYSDELENLEEMTQKRARDESSRSDEDISIDNTSSRPVKRTKKPSCYDIINSLSSSTNVSSGVKRKADVSRSGTPDVGKHFKSFDNSQSPSISQKLNSDQSRVNRIVNDKKLLIKDSPISSKSNLEIGSPKGILKTRAQEINNKNNENNKIEEKTNLKVNVPVKLTDRLFMKEEPQNIDKLKTLIDESNSLKPKFSCSDVEEIKKSDIVNMRQTSMKAKLKSMFDAISGKTASKIDPNVVIQAEAVTSTASISSPPSLASLSSSTCTTNVNTSPISTSAVTPIIGKVKPQDTPKKHVTWNLPDSSSSVSLNTNSLQSVNSENSVGGPVKLGSGIIPEYKPPTQPLLLFGSNSPLPVVTNSEKTPNVSNNSAPITAGLLFSTPKTSVPSTSTVTVTCNSSQSQPVSSVAPVETPKSTQAPLTFSFGTSSTSSSVVTTSSSTLPLYSQSTPKLGFQQISPTSTAPVVSAASFGTIPKSETLFNISQAATLTCSSSPSTSSGNPAPIFSLGGITTSDSSTKPTGFNFGGSSAISVANSSVNSTITSNSANAITSSSSFNFGSNTTSTPVFGTNSSIASTTTQSNFTFGANPVATTTTAPSSGFSFGGNQITASTAQSSGFSFNTNSSKPVFSFGGTTTSSQPPASTSTLTFGNPTTSATPPAFGTSSVSTPVPSFGAATTTATVPSFGVAAASTAAPSFGTQSTTVFGGTPTSSLFTPPSNQAFKPTTSTISFGTPNTTAPPNFGTPTSTAAPPAFGTPIITTAPPAFGTPTSTTSNSLFNGANKTAATTTISMFSGGSSIFGQTKPPAFGTTTTTNTSGFSANFSATPATLFSGTPTTTAGFGTNSTTTNTFGTANAVAPTFGNQTSTSAFGNPSTTAPSFGTNTVPSFGNSTVFGSQTTGATSPFSTATPTFGATTTAPPAFGTSTPSTSGFGTAAPTFGTPNTAPPAFGSTNTSFTGFGGTAASNPSPFGTTAPAFGAPSTSAPPPFGANTSGSTFAFGGTSTSTQNQPQQNSMFAFGAGSSNNGFQFNSTTPQTGGFNFTGSAGTPGSSGTPTFSSPSPALGTPGGGMFSIGSGSTGPRSRSARQGRKQR